MRNSISFEFDHNLNDAVNEMDRLTGYVVVRGTQWTEVYTGLTKEELDLVLELLCSSYPRTFEFSFNKDLENSEHYSLISRFIGEAESIDYV